MRGKEQIGRGVIALGIFTLGIFALPDVHLFLRLPSDADPTYENTFLRPHSHSCYGPSMLHPGDSLYAEREPSFLCSPNTQFRFGMAWDGDLSLWRGHTKVWSAGSCCSGRDASVFMQENGNLVVRSYDGEGSGMGEVREKVWSSRTADRKRHKKSVLEIGDDGQARIVTVGGSVLWRTGATCSVATCCKNSSYDAVYSFREEKDPKYRRGKRERKDRFPSVDDRVRLYMSNWYLPPCPQSSDIISFQYNKSSIYPSAASNGTVHIHQPSTDGIRSTQAIISTLSGRTDVVAILDNIGAIDCSRNEKYHPTILSYCSDLERDGAILFPPQPQNNFTADVLPPVLIIIGDQQPEITMAQSDIYSAPVFTKYRGSSSREDLAAVTRASDGKRCTDSRAWLQSVPEYQAGLVQLNLKSSLPSPIIWKLNTRRNFGPNLDKARRATISWKDKLDKAVWRGDLSGKWHIRNFDGEGAELSPDELCSLIPRCKFAMQHNRSSDIDAGLVLHFDEIFCANIDAWAKNQGMAKAALSVEEQLQYKIIISIEGNDVSSGLKWILESNSVVLMPPPTRTSWAMEELLEPFVHYVPMDEDGSNAEEMVQWILGNDEKARQIAERATLFMEDLLYHPDDVLL